MSISVAAYNAEKWIERCLNSFIVPEIIDEIEVLIINDGSTDRTSAIAREYTLRYPDTFILIDKENGGHGSTVNAAIKAASGKYFKIVDSDDWVEQNELVKLAGQLKNMEADVVISPYYIVKANSFSKQFVTCIDGLNSKYMNRVLNINQLEVKWELAMHGLTFYTEVLKNYFIPLDENCFYVDLEYIVFYFSHIQTVYISDIPIYNYLIGTNEQSVNMDNMIKRRSQHLQVCKRMIDYYSNCNFNTDVIRTVIESCIINEYRILLQIADANISKSEFMHFDHMLKELNSIMYVQVILNGIKLRKETALLVWFLRKIQFLGYRLIHYILHRV